MASSIPYFPPRKIPLNASFDLSSLTFRTNIHRHAMTRLGSAPTWTKLNTSDSLTRSERIKSTTEVVIANNPLSAAALYRDKQLWTDFNLSSTSTRVAFRYTTDHDHNTGMYLCWINSIGAPHHFYSISPSRDRNVDQNDHVETTYTGHGFVFCKLMNDSVARALLDRVKNRAEGVRQEDGIFVVNDDHGTFFLRKKGGLDGSESETDDTEDKVEESDEYESCHVCDGEICEVSHYSLLEESQTNNDAEKQNDHESDDKSLSSLNLEGEWEAYIIVGGFRLGSKMVPALEVNHVNHKEENDDKDANVHDTKVADLKEKDERSESDEDEEEWNIQLVTLVQKRISADHQSYKSPQSLFCIERNDIVSSLCPDLFQNNQFTVTTKHEKLDCTPVNTIDKYYDPQILGGWPCKVEPKSLSDQRIRERIIYDLNAACSHLPAHARAKLQKSTPIWINKTLVYGPKVAPVRGAGMCFHPGRGWLVRNGTNPAKKGGVEIFQSSTYLDDCHLWGTGGLMLHELSHAWHCLHCENGYDNAVIQNCYDQAMQEKLYDYVEFYYSKGKKSKSKAYACTNAMEYFAELSAAFLGGLDGKEYNKWFPFNRSQLKEHDPRAFQMLCQMWGIEDE